MTDYPTFYDTIIASPQWQAWVKENEVRPRYDVHESMECGWLSPQHFQAFMLFSIDPGLYEWEERGRGKL